MKATTCGGDILIHDRDIDHNIYLVGQHQPRRLCPYNVKVVPRHHVHSFLAQQSEVCTQQDLALRFNCQS